MQIIKHNKNLMKKILPKSGFTLVELLVVISIIAVLSVIGITLFSGAQSKARDSIRRNDLDAIKKALEQNFDGATGKYTGPVEDSWFANSKTPVDPTTTSNYAGLPTTTTPAFSICATLENPLGTSVCVYSQQK